MIPGKPLELAGRRFTVPALNLSALLAIRPQLQRWSLGVLSLEEALELVGDMLFFALKRNYPRITRGELDELVTRENVAEVAETIIAAGEKPNG